MNFASICVRMYLTNQRLVLRVLNSLQRTQHADLVFLLGVLIDRLHAWIMMLLIAEQDVIE